MTQHVRLWLGRVAEGQGEQHETFVRWLQSDEAQSQFAKYLLTGYSLVQHGELLKVVMRAEEPLAFIRFLRNPRMWPPCWEFVTAGRADHDTPESLEEHGEVRVDWRARSASPGLPPEGEARTRPSSGVG